MPKFDHGSKLIAETAGRQLARLAGVEIPTWQPAESTVQSIEKLADRVFLAGRGKKRFVVYFEFYTTWEASAPWDMLAKSGLLSQREQLPTVCIAVVLQRKGFQSKDGQLRLEAAGGPTQQLWYKELCLWKLKPEAWWEDEPGLMAFYPLCEHGRQPRDAILYAAGVIENKVAETGDRGERLALLTIFGELAFPTLNVEQIIGSEKMKESRMLKRIREEGELVRQRADVLRVLRVRMKAEPPADVASAVDVVDNVARLESLLDLAATCATIDEFRDALRLQEAAS